LPTMGCAAAPNPATGLSLKQRMHRFCCRCAADRGQATLLRPAGRSATAARSNKISAPSFCAKRVGVRLADDGLRSGPETCHWVEPETTHAPVLLPLRARSPTTSATLLRPPGRSATAARTNPVATPSGQNQKLRGQACAYSGIFVPLKSVLTPTVEANARHRPGLC
jgi:hypothetical protein